MEKGRDRHLASRLPYAGHRAGVETNSRCRLRSAGFGIGGTITAILP